MSRHWKSGFSLWHAVNTPTEGVGSAPEFPEDVDDILDDDYGPDNSDEDDE